MRNKQITIVVTNDQIRFIDKLVAQRKKKVVNISRGVIVRELIDKGIHGR